MPLTPPPLETPARFDPVYLSEDDLEDLVTFTGLSRQACLERLKNYSLTELAEAWRRADPKTSEEILRFYQSTDLYIWELMQWHASASRWPHWETLTALIGRFPAEAGYRRVYDFGCGVGTEGLFLASRGYEVTLVDVESPTFYFAQHRFRRRNLPVRFVVSRSTLPEPDRVYDVVICFDVFEHLPDPLEAARKLAAALRTGGVLAETASFWGSDLFPHHLKANELRYRGLRWYCHLTGFGLRYVSHSSIHLKASGWSTVLLRARYLFWRGTGLWVLRP